MQEAKQILTKLYRSQTNSLFPDFLPVAGMIYVIR